MKKLLLFRGFVVLAFLAFVLLGARTYMGATNFDRLVLGSGNFETDPNPTADLTFQNDEYISNSTDGRLDFGAANLLTTGTMGAGAGTFTSIASGAVTGTTGSFTGVFAIADSVDIQSLVIGRAQNSWLYLLRLVKHGGTVVLWGDTLGNLYAEGKIVADDSLRSQGPLLVNSTATVVGAFTASGKGVVTDSLRSQGPFLSNGVATLNSRLIGNASIAKIDSFSTTDSTKLVYMLGATLGDVAVISEYLPSYSAVADTGQKYAISYYSADTLQARRVPYSAGSTRKSGGLFSIIKVDR